MNGDIYLGESGSEVKLSAFGRTLSISEERISRSERTASGRLVEDIIARKKKFNLNYDPYIDGDALAGIIDLYELDSELSLIIYNFDTVNTYTVLMEPFDRERVRLESATGGAGGLWSGVSISLNEV